MLFTRVGAAAALAAISHAYLLPPTISSANKDIIKTLPFEDAVAIDGRVLQIKCPGCPVAITDIEGKMYTAQVESALRLNFYLSHNEADQLLLNGLQIYPVAPYSETFMEPLVAPQLVKSRSDTWEYASTTKLGYLLSVSHPANSSNQDQLDLIAIHLEIMEVADKFVHGIPGIDIKLLQTPSGKLMIGDAQISTPKSSASKPTDDGQECTTIICKWRAVVAAKLSKLKGCGGKAQPKGGHGSVRPHGHGRPRPHDPHRPHRHHHKHGGFARFLRNVVLHVFIPVVIGIVVGVTASLVGMIVGNIVIFLWRSVFRRGQPAQYTRVEQEETTAEEADNEKSFVEHQGPPPVYEDAVMNEKASE